MDESSVSEATTTLSTDMAPADNAVSSSGEGQPEPTTAETAPPGSIKPSSSSDSDASRIAPTISVNGEIGSDSESASEPSTGNLSRGTTPRTSHMRLPQLPEDNEALSLISKKLMLGQLILFDDVEEGDIHRFKSNAKYASTH